ncbi:Uncharacterised protein [Mycobacteroides abscessus subsp. abscessus]|nr:Uncharacterised protein [Mycobacteroides abscessus subsp. abscessus]
MVTLDAVELPDGRFQASSVPQVLSSAAATQ